MKNASYRMSDEGLNTSNWALLRWMLGLCWQERGVFSAAILLQIAVSMFAVFGLNLIGLGVDYLSHLMDGNEDDVSWPSFFVPPDSWSPMQTIVCISVAAILVAIVYGCAQYGAARATALLVHGRLAPSLQRQVFGKLQEVCMRFYSDNSTGSVINRATGDVQAVRSFVDLALMEAIVLFVMFWVYVAYMLQIHVWLTLACLSVAPLMAVLSANFSRVSRPLFLRYRDGFDRMILYLSETIRGAQVIRGYALEERAVQRMRDMNDELWKRQTKIFRSISFFSPSVNFLNHFGMFILLLYGGRLVVLGELPVGTGMVVFAGLLQQYSNRIGNVAQIANALQESLTGARRLREILAMRSSLDEIEDGLAPSSFNSSVQFEGVSVAYQEGRSALTRVSFEAQPGEIIGVVGETGSGKSALLHLIPRLYDPSEGCVCIGGVDARQYELNYLRRKIGVVFQDSFLFNAPILDNIRFGREHATREQIETAARIAQAHDFIQELEQGYDTIVGEFGVDLSGGQRQRIAIARALVDEPSILLLDDPTSAIDPVTEARILQALKATLKGRTTFIVAHRQATLKQVDKILLLSQGRLVAWGSHEDLLEENALYREAIEAQMHGNETEESFFERKAANL